MGDKSITHPLCPCPWGQTAACGSRSEHAFPGAGPARAAAGFCQISWARYDRPLSSGEMAAFLGGGEDIPRLLCSCPLPAPLPDSLPSWVSRSLPPFHTVSCSASQRPGCQVKLPWLLKMPVKCIYCGRATLLGSSRRISIIVIVFKNRTNYLLP